MNVPHTTGFRAPAIHVLTERELAEREQAAFRRGVDALYLCPQAPLTMAFEMARTKLVASADKYFPLPKITRLRTVMHEGDLYRSNTTTDQLERYSGHTNSWFPIAKAVSFAQMVQDLTNNPTEEVDA